MPVDTSTYAITSPCVTESITVASLRTYALEVEAALASVEASAAASLIRPSAIVRSAAGNAYTAGVNLIASFDTVIVNNNAMFNSGTPNVLTVVTAGAYLINFGISGNVISTNTSVRVEILIGGSPVAATESGPGLAGGFPPPSAMSTTMMMPLPVASTIQGRVLISGVNNNTVFPRLSATLVSYGGV